MITRPPSRYVFPGTDITPSSLISLVLKIRKKTIHAPTHGTSTHVFKQLNQIVRFKWKIIKTELQSLLQWTTLQGNDIKYKIMILSAKML